MLAPAALLGRGDVVGRDLAPEGVDLILGATRRDRSQHLLELVADAGADRVERAVVDVEQAVEADVRAVLGLEVDVDADRSHGQVAVQSRGDHLAVLAPVGLEQVQRVADVLDERALAHRSLAVAVGDCSGRRVRDVDVGDRRVGAGPGVEVGEDRIDGRRHAPGEERGHADRLEQVDRRPVAAADGPVALEVLDGRRRQQVALVAVEGDEDRPQVPVHREAVAHAEQRVHVPAEAQDPRVLGDRLVHRRVAVDGHDLEVGVDVRAPQLGAGAVFEVVQQADELAGPVQANVLVADQVPERGDRLDVVADVRRRAVGARVAVVDDRERAAAAGGWRGRRGLAVGGDPRAHPLHLALAVAPRPRVLAHVALEHGEHVAGHVLRPDAEHGGEDLEPRPGARLAGILGDQRADLGERPVRVDGEAGADVLGRGVGEPEPARYAPELGERQLGVPLPVGHDPAREVAERGRLLAALQALGDAPRGVVLPGGDERADLGDDRVVQRAAPLEPAQQRLARGGAGRRRRVRLPPLLPRLRPGRGLGPQPAGQEADVAQGEAAGEARHARRARRAAASRAPGGSPRGP